MTRVAAVAVMGFGSSCDRADERSEASAERARKVDAPAEPAAEPASVDEPNLARAAKPAIIPPEGGETLLFPDGRFARMKVDAVTTGAKSLLLGSEHIPAGRLIPVHRHDGYEEILFVHEGTATLRLGEERVVAEAGTTMFVPPGTWHGVANEHDDDVTVLFIFPTPEIGDFFRAVGHREGEPPKQTDWPALMKQHRMAVPEE